jgi:hypothetical protein
MRPDSGTAKFKHAFEIETARETAKRNRRLLPRRSRDFARSRPLNIPALLLDWRTESARGFWLPF